MADEITTKKVENLSENTEPADTDVYLFGASGTNVIKKIKWSNILTKLKSILFANNLTTTQEGYGLDARQGKTLKDEIDQLNTKLNGTRQFARFELSGIDLEAGITKQVTIPVTGLEGKTPDAWIVTPIGGYVLQTSVVGRSTNQVIVALRSDQAAAGRTIELYIFYH